MENFEGGLNQSMRISDLPVSVKFPLYYRHNLILMKREKVLEKRIEELEKEIKNKDNIIAKLRRSI